MDRREARRGARRLFDVRTPFEGRLLQTIRLANEQDVDDAVAAAARCLRETMRLMPVHQRAATLNKAAAILESRAEELAVSLVHETGKPITMCRTEARRGVEILRLAAEAARFVTGEVVPLDALSGGDGRVGLAIRTPLGVVAAISPFNAPINLSLQKIAPALATGCTVILKPADQAPLTISKLGEIFAAAGLPDGALSILPSNAATSQALVSHPGVSVVSFTGSSAVARKIQAQVGIKKVIYELGSNAPNIVCADADIESAASALVAAGFNSSGQICISAQRIYVHESVFDAFLNAFLARVKDVKVGDPFDEKVIMGTLINSDALDRISSWVEEAVAKGARALAGGMPHESGRNYCPTVLTGTSPDMKVQAEEIFGPVVTVTPFATDDEVIELANSSPYGLSAGLFTNDINRIFRFIRDLDIGNINVNEGSRYRQDNAPFSGVKQSGVGREGGRYALEEYTYTKFVGLKL